MRTLLLIGIVLAAGCAGAARSSGDDPAARVRALDAGWARAYETHYTAYAMRLMAEDFVMTSTDGSTKDRAREMADIRGSDDPEIHYFRTRAVDVRVHGDAAVVIGP